MLLVKKLSPNATVPSKGSEKAAGFDLSSSVNCVVPSRNRLLVQTDISISIPSETYARVAPRSGLALKKGIDVGAGVIDEDYRGNVGVILFNHSDEDFQILKGDRIAQLIIQKISMCKVLEVESLDETARGVSGYGSTGVRNIEIGHKDELKQAFDSGC
jgi:dUTP pyrophosphatase